MLKSHTLVPDWNYTRIGYELRPARDPSGRPVDGLYNAWIVLNNPTQFNSYTTDMVKEVILAFRQASMDRRIVAVVFTAVGDKAFCTGGNTREYAQYYAGNPQEYKQYMRLFNDMMDSILMCDKPVINRVNGMRVAGGQEIGMACDFSLAADTAVFGQAGPRHGSAPDGGSTDFLPLYVGFAAAMESGVLCEQWSAHRALQLGLLNQVDWPYWLKVLIALLVLDLAIWFQHLVSHKVPIFWRLHQVHHADRDIDVTTAVRFHPVEIALSMLWKIAIVVPLGASPFAVFLFEVILNACAMFNHANIALPAWLDRGLRIFIVTPDMHRVHHSVLRSEHDRNFGFNLSLWDRLFRTYRAEPEAGQQGMTIGLTPYQSEAPTRFGWSLLLPFWRQQQRND